MDSFDTTSHARGHRANGSATTSYAGYVGRVGALAVAVGVGAAVASMPVAFADTTGSAGSRGSSSADSSAVSSAAAKVSSRGTSRVRGTSGGGSSRGAGSAASVGASSSSAKNQRRMLPAARDLNPVAASPIDGVGVIAGSVVPSSLTPSPVSSVEWEAPAVTAPVLRSAPRAAAGSVDAVGSRVLAWLGGGGGDSATGPLGWAVLASARREFGAAAGTVAPAAVVSSGEPVTPLAAAALRAPGASATWQPGSILRIFVGNGTAKNPNAGILLGNGFSYDATTCPTGSCDGGEAGLLGNGGNGYNGGSGGSARWLGHGGNGGDAITVADGGDGGRGGLFAGYGGDGGAGADSESYPVSATIAVGDAPRRVTISPDGTAAYVVNFGGDSVSVLDIDSSSATYNTVIATIAVGADPLVSGATPDGTRLYVTNSGGSSLSVVDADAASATYNTVIATIGVGFEPQGIAITPDGTRAYVANAAGESLSVLDIDPASADYNTVTATVGVGVAPYAVVVSPDGTRLYANSDGSVLSVIDTDPASVG